MVEQKKKQSKLKWLFAGYIFLGFVGMLLCGYGYAARSTDLLVSGEATIKGVINFWSEYMQDVTPEECATVDFGVTTQMMDKRDGKKYWITKVGQNTCMMVQNLALELTTAGLDSRLSDINYSEFANYRTTMDGNRETIYYWDAQSTYPPVDTSVGTPLAYTGNSPEYYVSTYSWNAGEYVRKRPTAMGNIDVLNSLAQSGSFQNVTGWTDGLDYMTYGETYDTETKTYDAHYLVGNYYQAIAATAGSMPYSDSNQYYNATSSICPKGWRLPRKASTSAKTEFYEIYYDFLRVGTSSPRAKPLYFIDAGSIGTGRVLYPGYYGYYWTSTKAVNGTYVIGIDRGGGVSGTAQASSGYQGMSVRCILRSKDEL